MLSASEFALACPAWFAALPEDYKKIDNCLVFFQGPIAAFSTVMVWYCKPLNHLGNWIHFFSSDIWWNEDGEPVE